MIHVIHGKLEAYSKSRTSENFMIDETERGTPGGLSDGDAGEDADRVKFTLDGKAVSGWLWFSPFNEGDEVSAVVDHADGHHVVYAVLRPRDRLIALYPHCSRGSFAHWRAVFRSLLKWWAAISLLVLVIVAVMAAFTAVSYDNWLDRMREVALISFYVIAPLALVTAIAVGCKMMRFVRLAERIFSALDWPAVRGIDLIARSKAAPLDSNISFLEKDIDRLDEATFQPMPAEQARQLRKFHATQTSDPERMRLRYGSGFFRY